MNINKPGNMRAFMLPVGAVAIGNGPDLLNRLDVFVFPVPEINVDLFFVGYGIIWIGFGIGRRSIADKETAAVI